MDREQFDSGQCCDPFEFEAVWVEPDEIAFRLVTNFAQVSEQQEFKATPAAPDVPVAIGVMIALCYIGLIASLALATAGSAKSLFAIAIAALFVIVFFTVPRIFFAVEPDDNPRARLDQFFTNGIETLTGHNSGKEALLQMLIVPVLLILGVLAMGVTVAVVR